MIDRLEEGKMEKEEEEGTGQGECSMRESGTFSSLSLQLDAFSLFFFFPCNCMPKIYPLSCLLLLLSLLILNVTAVTTRIFKYRQHSTDILDFLFKLVMLLAMTTIGRGFKTLYLDNFELWFHSFYLDIFKFCRAILNI